MNFNARKQSFIKLGEFIVSNDPTFNAIKQQAYLKNNWFIPNFIDHALDKIATHFLTKNSLNEIAEKYQLNSIGLSNLNIGVIMAGNIPLVGFHDFLCVLLAGYNIQIKLSSKDDVLLPFLIQKLLEIEPAFKHKIEIKDRLTNCDAYITTGSNNSSRYFEYYFGKKPNIIRANKTSIAILNGQESEENLETLTNDIFLYFGMGCRNVSCLFLPLNYNFDKLIDSFKKYDFLKDHNKYKNNLDYQYAISLLNKEKIIFLENVLLKEINNYAIFSPISVLHFQYYTNYNDLIEMLPIQEIQCIESKFNTPFGIAQSPKITDFADGVDTMDFLIKLYKK